MPSSRTNVRKSAGYSPLLTDESHPSYPASCPRHLRALRAGEQAFAVYHSLIVICPPGLKQRLLQGVDDEIFFKVFRVKPSEKNWDSCYDEDGCLREEVRKQVGDFLITAYSKRHNVLWEEAGRFFTRARVLERMKRKPNELLHTNAHLP